MILATAMEAFHAELFGYAAGHRGKTTSNALVAYYTTASPVLVDTKPAAGFLIGN